MNTNEYILSNYKFDLDWVCKNPGDKFENQHATVILAHAKWLAGGGTPVPGTDDKVFDVTVEWSGLPFPVRIDFAGDGSVKGDEGVNIVVASGGLVYSGPKDEELDDARLRHHAARVAGTVIRKMTPAIEHYHGFTDLSYDVMWEMTKWDWSKPRVFWALARKSGATVTDNPAIAKSYFDNGHDACSEFRYYKQDNPNTRSWEITVWDVVSSDHFLGYPFPE